MTSAVDRPRPKAVLFLQVIGVVSLFAVIAAGAGALVLVIVLDLLGAALDATPGPDTSWP